MDQDRIVLDKKAFGALAVDSRVKLLKALTTRRKMLTELADELKLSASSTKEHLDTLVEAGLVEKFDEGHKWKYYALTRKGAGIITPDREIKVWVILGISIVGLLLSSLLMFNALPAVNEAALQAQPGMVTAPAVLSVQASQAPAPVAQAQTASGTENVSVDNSAAHVSALRAPDNVSMGDIAPESSETPPLDIPPPSLYMAFSALCALAAVICVVYLAIDRMR